MLLASYFDETLSSYRYGPCWFGACHYHQTEDSVIGSIVDNLSADAKTRSTVFGFSMRLWVEWMKQNSCIIALKREGECVWIETNTHSNQVIDFLIPALHGLNSFSPMGLQ
jgi:hypothetical protein